MNPTAIVLLYLAVMSFIAYAVTTYDKLAAKASRRRVPEKVLLLLAVLGGAIGEYVTMKLIRHKTKKPKFMITLPILCVIHIAAVCVVAYFYR